MAQCRFLVLIGLDCGNWSRWSQLSWSWSHLVLVSVSIVSVLISFVVSISLPIESGRGFDLSCKRIVLPTDKMSWRWSSKNFCGLGECVSWMWLCDWSFLAMRNQHFSWKVSQVGWFPWNETSVHVSQGSHGKGACLPTLMSMVRPADLGKIFIFGAPSQEHARWTGHKCP